ncbi:MAG: hypothetical protein ACRDDF_04920, partial [Aeromonas sp.]
MTFPANPQRYVHNLSGIILNEHQVNALSLGSKFCIPNTRDHQIELEVQFENLIRQTRDLIAVSDTELAHFKSTLVDCCHQYRASQLP